MYINCKNKQMLKVIHVKLVQVYKCIMIYDVCMICPKCKKASKKENKNYTKCTSSNSKRKAHA